MNFINYFYLKYYIFFIKNLKLISKLKLYNNNFYL